MLSPGAGYVNDYLRVRATHGVGPVGPSDPKRAGTPVEKTKNGRKKDVITLDKRRAVCYSHFNALKTKCFKSQVI
jgi:hypothetical protein